MTDPSTRRVRTSFRELVQPQKASAPTNQVTEHHTMQEDPMSRATPRTIRAAAALCLLALALGAGGCGLLPEQEAQTESVALEQPTPEEAAAAQTAEPTPADPTPADPTPAEPTPADQATSEAPTEPEDTASEEPTTSLQTGSATTFRDQDLDLSDRHPNGTRLEVTGIRFEGTAVLVDAEFINGHTQDIDINLQSRHSGIRLLDDLGNIYQVRPPDDATNETVTIASGETLSGSWAFLGPIEPDAQELRLVVNLYESELEDYDPATRYDGTPRPDFIMGPIPLEEGESA